jgi:hypothetical protein
MMLSRYAYHIMEEKIPRVRTIITLSEEDKKWLESRSRDWPEPYGANCGSGFPAAIKLLI